MIYTKLCILYILNKNTVLSFNNPIQWIWFQIQSLNNKAIFLRCVYFQTNIFNFLPNNRNDVLHAYYYIVTIAMMGSANVKSILIEGRNMIKIFNKS